MKVSLMNVSVNCPALEGDGPGEYASGGLALEVATFPSGWESEAPCEHVAQDKPSRCASSVWTPSTVVSDVDKGAN